MAVLENALKPCCKAHWSVLWDLVLRRADTLEAKVASAVAMKDTAEVSRVLVVPLDIILPVRCCPTEQPQKRARTETSPDAENETGTRVLRVGRVPVNQTSTLALGIGAFVVQSRTLPVSNAGVASPGKKQERDKQDASTVIFHCNGRVFDRKRY